MDIRDATPGDVEAVERLAPGELDGTRLILDRRVIVAEAGEGEDAEIVGFLSYDTWAGAVHVSKLVGEPDVLEELLEEPRRFADREELAIEIVVPESDTALHQALEQAGFEVAGDGPAFHGEATVRYSDTR